MVDGYCLDVIPCKILKSCFEKQLSYGQYMVIWFGLVWLGLVWFDFEWYGTWVMSRCTYMQNFEFLAWKMTELWSFKWHEFGKIGGAGGGGAGFMITKAL